MKRSEIDLQSQSSYCSSTGREAMVHELGCNYFCAVHVFSAVVGVLPMFRARVLSAAKFWRLGPRATAVAQFANPTDCGVRSIFGEKSNSPKTVELTWDAAETETSVRLKCIGYRPSIGIRIRSGYFPRNFKKSRHNGHFVSAHVCERHFHYWKRGLAFAEDNSGQP